MDATTIAFLAIIAVFGLALVVMIFGSLTGASWALITCPRCGARVPMAQWARSINQVLRGGWTCPACGFQVDRWGRPI